MYTLRQAWLCLEWREGQSCFQSQLLNDLTHHMTPSITFFNAWTLWGEQGHTTIFIPLLPVASLSLMRLPIQWTSEIPYDVKKDISFEIHFVVIMCVLLGWVLTMAHTQRSAQTYESRVRLKNNFWELALSFHGDSRDGVPGCQAHSPSPLIHWAISPAQQQQQKILNSLHWKLY